MAAPLNTKSATYSLIAPVPLRGRVVYYGWQERCERALCPSAPRGSSADRPYVHDAADYPDAGQKSHIRTVTKSEGYPPIVLYPLNI
jgi:hypothetical protein